MAFALITGASKGIGKAIARELAGKGFDLLLVARTESLLQNVAEEIRKDFGREAHWLTMDLSAPGASQKIFDWCRENNYAVSVLVNNAGYGLSGTFGTYTLQENMQMLQVNVNVVVELTQLFLPQLKQQSQAYILNISSTAAYQAVPYLALYSASKSFVLQFSRALRYELKKTSVSVTCISPGTTDTDFAHRANVGEKALKTAEKFNMTPEAVAKVCVDSMLKGKTEVVVGFLNKLGAFLTRLAPKKLSENTAAKIYE